MMWTGQALESLVLCVWGGGGGTNTSKKPTSTSGAERALFVGQTVTRALGGLPFAVLILPPDRCLIKSEKGLCNPVSSNRSASGPSRLSPFFTSRLHFQLHVESPQFEISELK